MSINATLFVQAVVFLLLVLFTMKFVWPPIAKALDERAQKVAAGLAAAEKAKAELASANQRVEKELQASRTETGNRLAKVPTFYNTVTTNCTTVVYRLVASVAPGWSFTLPLDPRVVLSGYLPGYLKDIGAVRQDLPLEELVRRGHIGEKARSLKPDSPEFSRVIREGVPTPRTQP